jgi:hypothetical protein
LTAKAGFKSVHFCQPKAETHYPQFIDDRALNMEWTGDEPEPHTLIVEGSKS